MAGGAVTNTSRRVGALDFTLRRVRDEPRSNHQEGGDSEEIFHRVSSSAAPDGATRAICKTFSVWESFECAKNLSVAVEQYTRAGIV